MLQKILKAKLQDELAVKQAMVDQLSLIRKRFKTGKVLDERLVELYIDLQETPSAIEILLDQRNGVAHAQRPHR